MCRVVHCDDNPLTPTILGEQLLEQVSVMLWEGGEDDDVVLAGF